MGTITAAAFIKGMSAIGAGAAMIAMAGVGIGIATGKAVEAIARQPEAAGDIRSTMLIGAALAEATAVYGFVIGVLIILFLGA